MILWWWLQITGDEVRSIIHTLSRTMNQTSIAQTCLFNEYVQVPKAGKERHGCMQCWFVAECVPLVKTMPLDAIRVIHVSHVHLVFTVVIELFHGFFDVR